MDRSDRCEIIEAALAGLCDGNPTEMLYTIADTLVAAFIGGAVDPKSRADLAAVMAATTADVLRIYDEFVAEGGLDDIEDDAEDDEAEGDHVGHLHSRINVKLSKIFFWF